MSGAGSTGSACKIKGEYPDKFLWIELGLQTIHEETAHYIRRGYPLSCFEKACTNLKTLKIPFIVHTILGLPGETDRQVLETMKYLNHIAPFGIKLQLLHILKIPIWQRIMKREYLRH